MTKTRTLHGFKARWQRLSASRSITASTLSLTASKGSLGSLHTCANGLLALKRPQAGGWKQWAAEVAAFPEYYENYFSRRMIGGQHCAAHGGLKAEEAFMPAVAPSGVGTNEFYRSDEEFLRAVGKALREEYQAIVDAGFILQIDDPWLTEVHSQDPSLSFAERRKIAERSIDALNHALRGIPAEKIRFHTCYGINEGPRVHDAPLKDIVDLVLKVNAGAYAFEAANARHEHEYHVWESVKLPEGKVLIPGVITHASNIVEHPELIAERITRYAKLVGRENVIAGSDCGFSSQATYNPEVHPKVVWAKFQAMAGRRSPGNEAALALSAATQLMPAA